MVLINHVLSLGYITQVRSDAKTYFQLVSGDKLCRPASISAAVKNRSLV